MTDKRDTPAGKRRASRKKPESEVDREGLARIVDGRMKELKDREGLTQTKVAELVGGSSSTIRNMQHGTGKSHYEHDTLRRVASVLRLPEDQLVNTYYRLKPRDPAPPDDGVMTQWLRDQLAPYLAQIIDERLQGIAGEVHEVRSLLKSFVDAYQHPDE